MYQNTVQGNSNGVSDTASQVEPKRSQSHLLQHEKCADIAFSSQPIINEFVAEQAMMQIDCRDIESLRALPEAGKAFALEFQANAYGHLYSMFSSHGMLAQITDGQAQDGDHVKREDFLLCLVVLSWNNHWMREAPLFTTRDVFSVATPLGPAPRARHVGPALRESGRIEDDKDPSIAKDRRVSVIWPSAPAVQKVAYRAYATLIHSACQAYIDHQNYPGLTTPERWEAAEQSPLTGTVYQEVLQVYRDVYGNDFSDRFVLAKPLGEEARA